MASANAALKNISLISIDCSPGAHAISCHGHPALYLCHARPGRIYHLEAAHRPAATPARQPRTLSSI